MTSDSFQELLSDIRTSGQPPKRYCKEHGVHYSTYQYWLRKTKASSQTENSGFLKLVPIPAAPASLDVRVPNGAVIVVHFGFDAGLLRMRWLPDACCFIFFSRNFLWSGFTDMRKIFDGLVCLVEQTGLEPIVR